MGGIATSLIAVAGTLLGSVSTYLFQRRTAARTEGAAREERLRQERLLACSEFLTAVAELKRAAISAWFRREDKGEEWRSAMVEADRSGAAAESAHARLTLTVGDSSVHGAARELFASITVLREAVDKGDMENRELEYEAKRTAFIDAARTLLAG
jgi:hypothetical protein